MSIEESADERELRGWMIAAQAGDRDAYGMLLGRVDRLLRQFARNRISEESAALDVVQEILLAIHAKRATYDASQPFLPWMYAIARYKCVDWFRARKLESRLQSIDDEETGLAERLVAREAEAGSGADAAALLDSLPRKQREIVRLVKIEGLSVQEASMRTGFSPSDIKVSVHRALLSLRKRLKKEGA